MAEFGGKDPPKRSIDLAKLCPKLSPEELEEARENLRRYVVLALRVFERLESDPDAMARFDALTASRRASTMNAKGRENEEKINS